MITRLPNMPENILAFEAKDEVTAKDYESVLIPAVESVLKKYKKIRLFYQFGEGFKAFTPGAMWDDAKVAMKHLTAWEKVAIVTDVDWLRNTIRCIGFLLPGTVKLFHNDEAAAAREWIIY